MSQFYRVPLKRKKIINNFKINLYSSRYASGNVKVDSTDIQNLEKPIHETIYKQYHSIFYKDNKMQTIFLLLDIFQWLGKSKPTHLIISELSNKDDILNYKIVKSMQNLLGFRVSVIIFDSCSFNALTNIKASKPDWGFRFFISENPIYFPYKSPNKCKIPYAYGLFVPLPKKVYLPSIEKTYDFCFLGQVNSYRSYRKEYIEALAELALEGMNSYISTRERQEWLNYDEYRSIMSSSILSINFSMSVDYHQLKGRIFESIDSGCYLIESEGSPLSFYLEKGEDYDTFSSPSELKEKILHRIVNKKETLKKALKTRQKLQELCNNQDFFNNIIF